MGVAVAGDGALLVAMTWLNSDVWRVSYQGNARPAGRSGFDAEERWRLHQSRRSTFITTCFFLVPFRQRCFGVLRCLNALAKWVL